jgi:imidazolonepropionase-like amidohydrolase
MSVIPPGFSLQEELSLLVNSGLTPAEALRAATITPAIALGKEKELGSIVPGKLADLVLLDANPLENINNTRRISAVLVGGKLLRRADLDTLLAASIRAAAAN